MATKNKFMNAMKMPAIADMFSSEADRQRESGDLVTEVPLSELHPFVNHPFEVRDDEDMQVVSYIVMVEVLPFLGLGFIHHDDIRDDLHIHPQPVQTDKAGRNRQHRSRSKAGQLAER